MPEKGTEAAEVGRLAIASVTPKEVKPGELWLVRTATGDPVVVDLEALDGAPRRQRGSVRFTEPGSFAAWVNAMVEIDAPAPAAARAAMWANRRGAQVVCVLNGPADVSAPGWGDLQAILTLLSSREWDRWKARDKQRGDLRTFAQHIEDNLPDIVKPDGATMMEVALGFQAHTTAAFNEGVVLHSGVRSFGWKEETQATVRDGKVDVPTRFTVRLRPYEGTDPVELDAHLRYQISEGKLSIGYELIRADEARDAAFDALLEGIRATTSGIPVYAGEVPSPQTPSSAAPLGAASATSFR